MSDPESKTRNKRFDMGTDGETLDGRSDSEESLPSGLVRMRSGSIAVTKLFCPAGHNLMDDKSKHRFNGLPGIALMVEGARKKGIVILSPIHGDDSKFGETGFELGEVLRLSCPVCQSGFPVIQECGCADGAGLVGLYLSEDLKDGNQVALCTAWGCLRSRIVDRFQIISKLK